jgi:hypothetical protein
VSEETRDERVPTLSEQMAEQLGGWRGLVESSIPVLVFVVANIVWTLRPALMLSVATAVVLAGVRLAQRRPVRHAVNGLFGIGIGAVLAWRSGNARDFYLPGILYSYAYALVMLGSIAIRRPLVGWLWSVVADGGSQRWRQNPRLVRTFAWLTALWAATWIAKVSVQAVLFVMHQDTALGVARLVLGFPPYLLLLVVTVWVVRRVMRTEPVAEPVATVPAG